MIYEDLLAAYDRASEDDEAERWRSYSLAVLEIVARNEPLGDVAHGFWTQARALWEDGHPAEDAKADIRVAIWRYNDAKHGTSTLIKDREDKVLRSILCAVEPVGGRSDAADGAGWISELLSDSTA